MSLLTTEAYNKILHFGSRDQISGVQDSGRGEPWKLQAIVTSLRNGLSEKKVSIPSSICFRQFS